MPDKTRKAEFEKFAATATGAKSWFLGIGINKYKHFPILQNAVKDVQDLVALLQAEYDFEPQYTKTLFDEEATRGGIIEMLDEQMKEIGPQDKVLIYYSGHGLLNPDNKLGYWVTTNAKPDSTVEYINNSAVRDYMKAFKSLHTLLISDSCFSGNLLMRGKMRSTADLSELANMPSRWVICSGQHDEVVYDGDPDTNSPFAHSILTTLKQNPNRELNVSKLFEWVREQTRANSRQLPIGTPLENANHQGGQYIFRRRAVDAEDWAKAMAANTIPAYESYLENHRKGGMAEQAQVQIDKLKDDAAWEEASRVHTTQSYYHYSSNFEEGKYLEQALKAINELEEEGNWGLARSRHTIFEYAQYRKRHPGGKYAEEAKAAADAIYRQQSVASQLEEDGCWKQAQEQDSVKSYQVYLGKYPTGRYAEPAEERLSALQALAIQTMKEKRLAEREARRKQWQQQRAIVWGRLKTAGSRLYRVLVLMGAYVGKATGWLGQQLEKGFSFVIARLGVDAARFGGQRKLGRIVLGAAGVIIALLLTMPLWPPGARADPSDPSPRYSDNSSSIESEGQKYSVLSLNDLDWMVENLNYFISEKSWYPSGAKKEAGKKKYGRLYTWEAAKQACSKLGLSWRLPTEKEWKTLIEAYGGYVPNAEGKYPKEKAEIEKLVDAGFEIFPVGHYNKGAHEFNELGYYWSSDEKNRQQAVGYSFDHKYSLALMGYEKSFGLSCRCVRNP